MAFKRDYNKYLVLKQDDIGKYLVGSQKTELEEIRRFVRANRLAEGKKDNTYVVVNEDEPYAEIVWKLVELSQTRPEGLSTLLHNLLEELSQFDRAWESFRSSSKEVGNPQEAS